MKYDPNYIASFYDNVGIKEWSRFETSPLEEIKLHIHNQFLKQFARKENKVLEIGAGPGRFTQLLAKLGARIIVTDISPKQVSLNKQRANEHGYEFAITDWDTADITNLSNFGQDEFDVILAYGGPLSYVFEKSGVALQNCHRVLKPGGIFVASVMSLWGTIHQHLKGVLDIDKKANDQIILTGDLTPETQSKESTHYCHMFRSKEFRKLFEKNGFRVEKMSASNSLSTNHNTILSEIRTNNTKWNELLELEQQACEEPGMLDAGTHILIGARKPA